MSETARQRNGLAEKPDDELISDARSVYRDLQHTPRWSGDNDRLIRAWGEVCAEMNMRGLTDDITQGTADRPVRPA
jgi:hypothetical protein